MLEENYVDVATARRYAAAVRTAAARGDYDNAGTVSALARMLTRDVLAVSPDGHLRVLPAGSERGPAPLRLMRRVGGPDDNIAPMEPGPGRPIEEARWLAPGIAYIRFTLFAGEPQTMAAVARFMREHSNAETVIFDLRTNRGGAVHEVHSIFPFLFAQETALMRVDVRASVPRPSPPGAELNRRSLEAPDGMVSWEEFATPHPTERGLFDARVIVLTSNGTGSAAEHFALALKSSGRGTLIGERTAGAGNFAFGGPQPLGQKFTAFIPVGRSYDPRGGGGFEGTGVQPDIAVPAERALVEALTRAGVATAEAERLSASVHPSAPMRRPPPQI
jgi:C-terminal processing protease CtpA/Prc